MTPFCAKGDKLGLSWLQNGLHDEMSLISFSSSEHFFPGVPASKL
jgi:hypothetical protein